MKALQDVLYKLNKELIGKVFENERMSLHTSFKTGGPADIFITPENIDDIKTALCILKEADIPTLVIGNGTNLLVRDKGIRGAVVQIGGRFGLIRTNGNIIEAEAGALMSAVSQNAAAGSLSGLEFAAGIPGTVGGGIFMNAGAYDGEIKDVLTSVTVLDKNFDISEIDASELELGYRHSNIEERGIVILKGTFSLKPGDSGEINEKIRDFNSRRRDKQPLNYPSAGSTFKRPTGFFAGKLISDCGLKGKTIGGAGVSEKHAGFIINIGGATSRDILDLIEYCQKEVKDKFGVKLDTEVKIVGEE